MNQFAKILSKLNNLRPPIEMNSVRIKKKQNANDIQVLLPIGVNSQFNNYGNLYVRTIYGSIV